MLLVLIELCAFQCFSCGLQSVAGIFETHVAVGQAIQFLVDQRGDLLHSRSVPPAPGLEQLGDFRGRHCSHVFSDRLTEVSRCQRVPLELVLGITTAHEIGHLLLPGQPHALAGVMRAELNAKDWSLAAQAGLGFTDGQKKIILAGVEARTAQPPSANRTVHLNREEPGSKPPVPALQAQVAAAPCRAAQLNGRWPS